MGNYSEEDFALFLEWINSSEKNKEEFEKISAYWKAPITYNHRKYNAEESLNKTLSKIYMSEFNRKRIVRIIRFSLLAASFLLCFVLGRFLNLQNQQELPSQYVYLNSDSKPTFYLPDSTKIILNENSKLTYTSHYGVSDRKINLEGEAYLEVRKNKKIPFTIDMGNSSITVLGTKFTVKNRTSEKIMKAVLMEGSIRFNSSSQQITLEPNQQILFNRHNNQILKLSEVNTDEETAWTKGLVKIKSKLLPDAFQILSEKYHIKIVLSERIKKDKSTKLTATFLERASTPEILNTIKKSVRLSWKERKGIYYIY